MKLTDLQEEQVRGWVASGLGIGGVQTKLEKEFGISMTYMDVRFLIDDIGAEIKEPEKKADLSGALQNAGALPDAADALQEGLGGSASGDVAGDSLSGEGADVGRVGAGGHFDGGENLSEGRAEGVNISVDELPKSGCVASGSVVFSDGGSAKWAVRRDGGLDFAPEVDGYMPPTQDIGEFENKLREVMGGGSSSGDGDASDSKIKVTLSPLQRPDSLAFGDVEFSDGSKAEWRIDRIGQLVLIPSDPQKKPPQDDMPAFERKLSKILSKMY